MSDQVIETLIDTNQFTQAKEFCERIVHQQPRNVTALYYMGYSELMLENYAGALHWLLQAFTLNNNSVQCATNIGVAYYQQGEADAAKTYFERALDLDADAELAAYNLAALHIEQARPKLAMPLFRSLIKRFPDNVSYLCGLADAVRATGRLERSVSLYRKVLEKDATYEPGLTNCVKILLQSGAVGNARAICEAALLLKPKHFVALRYLGECLTLEEQYDEAMHAFADAYELNSEDAELCGAIASMWLRAQDYFEAANWLSHTIRLDEENLKARCGLIHITKEIGDPDVAIAQIEALLEAHPEDENVLLTASDLMWEDGDANAALSHLEVLRQLKPYKIQYILKIAQILSSAGQVKRAEGLYREVLQGSPNCTQALGGLAVIAKDKLCDAHVAKMHHLIESRTLADSTKSQLYSGLTQYYDGAKDYAHAAEYSRLANACQWAALSKIRWSYEPDDFDEHIAEIIKTFDAAYFERLAARETGDCDVVPVFVIGMPRSGTTLTEQILGRHAQVLGMGERNFASRAFHAFIARLEEDAGVQPMQKGSPRAAKEPLRERLRCAFSQPVPSELAAVADAYLAKLIKIRTKSDKAGAIRIVDKMPDNYSLLGWILTLFPNAKIIHCQREPRDVALSCWMTQFGAIPWACHSEHLARRILAYQKMMAHWESVLPGRFLSINYEDLVSNQADRSRALIEYLGLTWDPACMEFYKSDRLIRTASVTQVRKPVYTSSVNKWQHYREHLGDLFALIDAHKA